MIELNVIINLFIHINKLVISLSLTKVRNYLL